MRLQRIRSLDELDSLKEAWINLENVKGGPSIFQSWTWNRTWCESVLSHRKRARLDVRVFEDGAGRALAILPFFEENLVGPLVKLVQFLGHKLSYHNDILLADPNNVELTDEVIKRLRDGISPRTILHLRHLTNESLFTKQLFVKGMAEPQCDRILIKFDPNITDHTLRLSRSTRKSLRRRENKLFKEYDCEFQVCSDEGFPKAFDAFVALHEKRLASMKRASVLKGINLAFLKKVIPLIKLQGKFEITQLHADKQIIAATFMLRDNRHIFGVNTGFDPEFSAYAPLKLLISETMRRAFNELGCDIYDFGPGYESYKYDWKPSISTNYFCCLGGDHFYGKSLAALYSIAFRRKVQSHKNIRR